MRNRTKKLVALLMILSLGLSIFGNSFDNTAKAATKKVVLNILLFIYFNGMLK